MVASCHLCEPSDLLFFTQSAMGSKPSFFFIHPDENVCVETRAFHAICSDQEA